MSKANKKFLHNVLIIYNRPMRFYDTNCDFYNFSSEEESSEDLRTADACLSLLQV